MIEVAQTGERSAIRIRERASEELGIPPGLGADSSSILRRSSATADFEFLRSPRLSLAFTYNANPPIRLLPALPVLVRVPRGGGGAAWSAHAYRLLRDCSPWLFDRRLSSLFVAVAQAFASRSPGAYLPQEKPWR